MSSDIPAVEMLMEISPEPGAVSTPEPNWSAKKFHFQKELYDLNTHQPVAENIFHGYRLLQQLMLPPKRKDIFPFLSNLGPDDEGSPFHRPGKACKTLPQMKDMLERSAYASLTEFVKDVRDMFVAYVRYHGPEHVVSANCEKLEAVMQQKIALLPRIYRDMCGIEVTHPSELKTSEWSTRSARKIAQNLSSTLIQQLKQEARELEKEERKRQLVNREKEREILKHELACWETELFAENNMIQMLSSWELPQIGLFLYLCQTPLNCGSISQCEVERMFLICKGSQSMALVMTSLLSKPHQRQYLDRRPAMPYHMWSANLCTRLNNWYTVLEKCDNNHEIAADMLGIEPMFWDVVGRRRNPLAHKPFHELTYFQKIWTVKSLCEACVSSQSSIREAIEGEPPDDTRGYVLGTDSTGATYINFPQFCGDDIRIYKVKRKRGKKRAHQYEEVVDDTPVKVPNRCASPVDVCTLPSNDTHTTSTSAASPVPSRQPRSAEKSNTLKTSKAETISRAERLARRSAKFEDWRAFKDLQGFASAEPSSNSTSNDGDSVGPSKTLLSKSNVRKSRKLRQSKSTSQQDSSAYTNQTDTNISTSNTTNSVLSTDVAEQVTDESTDVGTHLSRSNMDTEHSDSDISQTQSMEKSQVDSCSHDQTSTIHSSEVVTLRSSDVIKSEPLQIDEETECANNHKSDQLNSETKLEGNSIKLEPVWEEPNTISECNGVPSERVDELGAGKSSECDEQSGQPLNDASQTTSNASSHCGNAENSSVSNNIESSTTSCSASLDSVVTTGMAGATSTSSDQASSSEVKLAENSLTKDSQLGDYNSTSIKVEKDCTGVEVEAEHEEDLITESPDTDSYRLVCQSIEELRDLCHVFSYGRGKEVELHESLERFLSDLLPYETKLLQAQHKYKEKLKKEQEAYVEPSKETTAEVNGVWDTEEDEENTCDISDKASNAADSEFPTESIEITSESQVRENRAKTSLPSDKTDTEQEFGMSAFGRRRKRRIIPNNAETEVFAKKKAKKEKVVVTSTSTTTTTTTSTTASKTIPSATLCTSTNIKVPDGFVLVKIQRQLYLVAKEQLPALLTQTKLQIVAQSERTKAAHSGNTLISTSQTKPTNKQHQTQPQANPLQINTITHREPSLQQLPAKDLSNSRPFTLTRKSQQLVDSLSNMSTVTTTSTSGPLKFTVPLHGCSDPLGLLKQNSSTRTTPATSTSLIGKLQCSTNKIRVISSTGPTYSRIKTTTTQSTIKLVQPAAAVTNVNKLQENPHTSQAGDSRLNVAGVKLEPTDEVKGIDNVQITQIVSLAADGSLKFFDNDGRDKAKDITSSSNQQGQESFSITEQNNLSINTSNDCKKSLTTSADLAYVSSSGSNDTQSVVDSNMLVSNKSDSATTRVTMRLPNATIQVPSSVVANLLSFAAHSPVALSSTSHHTVPSSVRIIPSATSSVSSATRTSSVLKTVSPSISGSSLLRTTSATGTTSPLAWTIVSSSSATTSATTSAAQPACTTSTTDTVSIKPVSLTAPYTSYLPKGQSALIVGSPSKAMHTTVVGSRPRTASTNLVGSLSKPTAITVVGPSPKAATAVSSTPAVTSGAISGTLFKASSGSIIAFQPKTSTIGGSISKSFTATIGSLPVKSSSSPLRLAASTGAAQPRQAVIGSLVKSNTDLLSPKKTSILSVAPGLKGLVLDQNKLAMAGHQIRTTGPSQPAVVSINRHVRPTVHLSQQQQKPGVSQTVLLQGQSPVVLKQVVTSSSSKPATPTISQQPAQPIVLRPPSAIKHITTKKTLVPLASKPRPVTSSAVVITTGNNTQAMSSANTASTIMVPASIVQSTSLNSNQLKTVTQSVAPVNIGKSAAAQQLALVKGVHQLVHLNSRDSTNRALTPTQRIAPLGITPKVQTRAVIVPQLVQQGSMNRGVVRLSTTNHLGPGTNKLVVLKRANRGFYIPTAAVPTKTLVPAQIVMPIQIAATPVVTSAQTSTANSTSSKDKS